MIPQSIETPKRPAGLRFEVPAIANPGFHVQALASGGVISIFDVIGPDTNTRRIAAALRQIGPQPITVEINSPGGDAFEGIGIYNALRAHGQPITVQVLGLAASAASIVAMAGDKVQIARNGQIMIHNAHALAVGDAAMLAHVSEILARVDQTLVETYAARTGLPGHQIADLMAAETFMTAAEARQLGFADQLLERDAEPELQVADGVTPQTKIGLEQRLRSSGFTKSAAERIAAGGFPALRTTPPNLDLTAVGACFTARVQALRAALRS